MDRLLHPDRPELHSSEARDGTISGFIPARLTEIESSEDPEKMGRIKVQCELFSTSDSIPNSFDGWVFVGTPFCNTGQVGGAHPKLVRGNQVALLPMLGNPTQLLMICAIHSRSDRPNPLFDRSKDVHGVHTSGGVFDIHNDEEDSRQTVYPHGVVKAVGADGSLLDQTAGARRYITQDGAAETSNENASSTISPEGTVLHESLQGEVSLRLDESGQGVMRSDRFQSKIEMTSGNTIMTGPAPSLFGLLRNLKRSALNKFGSAKAQVDELTGLVNNFGELSIDELPDVLDKSLELVTSVGQGFNQLISEGEGVLREIQDFDLQELGEYLMPQVQAVLDAGIHELLPQLEGVLNEGVEALTELLEVNGLPVLDDAKLGAYDALRVAQPEQAVQLVLSEVMPEGFESFANLSAIGLHGQVGLIDQLVRDGNSLSEALNGSVEAISAVLQNGLIQAGDATTVTETILRRELENCSQKLSSLIPAEIRPFIQSTGIFETVAGAWQDGNQVNFDGLMQTALGSVAQGFAGQALTGLLATTPYGAAIPVVQGMIGGLLNGESLDLSGIASSLTSIPGLDEFAGITGLVGEPLDFVSNVTGIFSGGLSSLFGGGTKSINQLVNSLPTLQHRARIEANQVTAGLIGGNGRSRVFASEAGVGITSPWGGFSFDRGGAHFAGRMLVNILGSGLRIDPEQGVAIVGLDESGLVELSRVEAQGSTVLVQSGNNRIQVNRSGVYVNGLNLERLAYYDFDNLFNRIEALETAANQTGNNP